MQQMKRIIPIVRWSWKSWKTSIVKLTTLTSRSSKCPTRDTRANGVSRSYLQLCTLESASQAYTEVKNTTCCSLF